MKKALSFSEQAAVQMAVKNYCGPIAEVPSLKIESPNAKLLGEMNADEKVAYTLIMIAMKRIQKIKSRRRKRKHDDAKVFILEDRCVCIYQFFENSLYKRFPQLSNRKFSLYWQPGWKIFISKFISINFEKVFTPNMLHTQYVEILQKN
ncbi:MAG: hypothetical protein WDN09_01110 [bacterium]